MKLIDAQFQMSLARAALATAEINSGAYKLSRSQVGCGRNEDGTIQFRDQTDEEKLAGAVSRARNFLRFAQDCMDHEKFGDQKHEEPACVLCDGYGERLHSDGLMHPCTHAP